MDNYSLDDILENDPLELLIEFKVKNPIISFDDRLIAKFEEINDFYEIDLNEPTKLNSMSERALAVRLQKLRENPTKIITLQKYDRFNLLSVKEIVEVTSLDDIFENDPLGLLESDDEDIFVLKNVPLIDKERAEADFVARRAKCKNFEEYEHLFIACQKDLKDGKRRLVKFNERFYENGAFFVMKGVLLYLENIEKKMKDRYSKFDARTNIIFENGTQSNMYLRSLGKGLYEDGYFVSKHEDKIMNELNQINDEDKQNGYIYILKSLSNDDRIVTKKDLYKIGFSTVEVKDRIKNAKNDPTYLMADVKIVSHFEVYNVNPHKLEQIIHKFFSTVCLDIEIIDKNEKIYKPMEWFIVPLNIIEKAINLIITGEIMNYRYNLNSENIYRYKTNKQKDKK